MSLASRLLGANPSAQVSSLLSGSLTTPSAKLPLDPNTSFQSLGTTTLTGTQSEVTFSNLSGFGVLIFRGRLFSSSSGSAYNGMRIRFNADSGSNYNWRRYTFDGSSLIPGNYQNSDTSIAISIGAAQSDTTDYGSIFEFRIVNPDGTARWKQLHGRFGHRNNGARGTAGNAGYEDVIGSWKNTAALTSVTFAPIVALGAGTVISVYGAKDA